MNKKILIILLAFILLVTGGIIYLNEVFLPTKIKSLVIKGIEESTGKKASLESVRLSLLKGLVIRNLVISDNQVTILSLKEGSCTFLLLPVFKKILILPTVNFDSAVIFLERRKDNTFNIQDLIPKNTQGAQKPKFDFFVYRVSIHNATIKYQDDTFAQPYTRNLENLDITFHFGLPAKVKFNLNAQIADTLPIKIRVQGEYKIPEKELDARIVLKDLAPRSFLVYYQDSGLTFPEGSIDSQINLKFKEDIISAGLFLQSKSVSIDKKKYTTKLNSTITANVWYNLKNNQFDFNGKAQIVDSGYLGLDFIGPISAVNGEVSFNKAGLWSDKLTANIWGLPLEAKGGISDFSKMLFEVNIKSDLGLSLTQELLKDKLKVSIPGALKGQSKLSLTIQNKSPVEGKTVVNGSLNISDGLAGLDKVPFPLTDINGKIEYRENQVTWPKLSFKYLGIPYATKGSVIDFKAPNVLLELSSSELNLLTNLTVNDKLINIVNLSGHYLNSGFSLKGNIDTSKANAVEANLSGALDVELNDLGKPLDKLKATLEKIRPAGKVHADFNFFGNVNNLKTCSIQAKLSGNSLSFFGLKTDELLMNYNQANSLIDIPVMHAALYDGTIDTTVRLDLAQDSPEYWMNAVIEGIDLAKLKADTPLKDEDIEGLISTQFKVNGHFKDLSTLNGIGKISITNGKLWELNLFKGVGGLLLVKDFAKIIFREGDCDFVLKDNFISTNNLMLKSAIVELLGPVKIGFADNSIDATLQVNVIDEMVPLTGTFRDVTTAIVGQAGRFGVIRITGTMKEPKFKFKAAVIDILKGLTDTIFGKPSE